MLIGSYSRHAKFFYLLSLLSLFIISAFRDPAMAGDFPNYERIFKESPLLGEFFSYGPESLSEYTIGYVLLNSLAKSFINDYYFFQVVHSFVGISLLWLVIHRLNLSYKEKCYLLLSIFCFIFIWYFWNILRQNVANLLFWLFLIWYYKKQPSYNLKNWILIFCGIFIPSLFHSSGLINFVLFPLMLLVGKLTPKTRLKVIVPISISVYVLSSYVIGPLLSVMVNVIAPRYDMYTGAAAGNGNIINYSLKLLFLILFSYHYNKENYPYKKMVLDTLTMVVLISSVNQELLNRVYEYYAIGLYMSFCFVSHYFRRLDKNLVSLVFAIGLIIIFIRFIHISCDGGFLEYKFM